MLEKRAGREHFRTKSFLKSAHFFSILSFFSYLRKGKQGNVGANRGRSRVPNVLKSRRETYQEFLSKRQDANLEAGKYCSSRKTVGNGVVPIRADSDVVRAWNHSHKIGTRGTFHA